MTRKAKLLAKNGKTKVEMRYSDGKQVWEGLDGPGNIKLKEGYWIGNKDGIYHHNLKNDEDALCFFMEFFG